MARSIRVAGRPPSPSAPPPGSLAPDAAIPLRLTVTRGALGLELYEAMSLGPVEVRRLSVSLPDLRYPVDLSGGVRPFRHRRGRLEQLGLRLRLDLVARWLDRRLREALGGLVRPVSVWRVPHGVGLGLVGRQGAVAFDLLWAPVEADARGVVARARGAELEGPALGVALAVVDTALGRVARREGRVVTIPELAALVAREVMPSVGARAPLATGVRCSALEGEGDSILIDADASFGPPPLAAEVVSALELAALSATADEALARGQLEVARAAYVAALEQAPRHPELSRLVAELDVHAGGRAEAALSMLTESVGATRAGPVGAVLLARTGDDRGAIEALRAATLHEEYAPLAALLWARMATIAGDAGERAAALDEAVARCPGLDRVRWQRFDARAARGDVASALADAEHLEANASGSAARHDVCREAARRLLALGYQRDAGRLFERALRYVPDDPAATAGLGRALVETGRTARAAALLERAIELGEQKGAPQPDALVDLAKLLARASDLPQAIARVRQVAAPSERLVEARGLEAEWRAALGDVTGASLAYARLRETAELSPPTDVRLATDFLQGAARFEWGTRGDAVAAERHLSVALRLDPRSRSVAEAYREMAAIAAGVDAASR